VAAGTDGGRSAADRIERQVRTLSRVVDNMLVVSRLLVGGLELRPTPMDLAQVVREEVARVAGGESIQVRADTPIVGSWDKEKVAQVVGNLLSNALKFGAGKPVSVEVEQAERVARLIVVDHGVGIDQASTPELFAKFERGVSSRAYGGLGLGLFVVQSIVEAMGGSVRVRSRPAVETRFVVDFPA
jgi:signal transduction histidine kinase